MNHLPMQEGEAQRPQEANRRSQKVTQILASGENKFWKILGGPTQQNKGRVLEELGRGKCDQNILHKTDFN